MLNLKQVVYLRYFSPKFVIQNHEKLRKCILFFNFVYEGGVCKILWTLYPKFNSIK